ncbi:hypothetical protein SDC9_173647 [bioreactor metagenome]|uniref:Uncharacterized protein n=1 Tax=bioreactor metagenome TaxID=1076179 RepID=A0A645GRG9_9ZZZZ
MDAGGGQHPGHVLVDLKIDVLCLPNHSQTDGGHTPGAEISMLVHWRNRGAVCVHVHIISKKRRNVPITAGHQISIAPCDSPSGACARKPGNSPDSFKGLPSIACHGQDIQHRVHLHAAQCAGAHTLSYGLIDGARDGQGNIRAKGPAVLSLPRNLLRSH